MKEDLFVNRNSRFSKYPIPLERVKEVMGGDATLKKLSEVKRVKPELVVGILKHLHRAFEITHQRSNKTIGRYEILRDAEGALDEVGESIFGLDDGYDHVAHELLRVLIRKDEWIETRVSKIGPISGRQLLNAMGALGVAMRKPEHIEARGSMSDCLINRGREMPEDYCFAVTSLLGIKFGVA